MRSTHILLIEDNDGDILLTTEALEESKVINTVTVIRDGKAAIDFFAAEDPNKEMPDLVLLDINLPKKSGLEVLRFIKQSEMHKHIPLIMLTTSSAEKDILLSYKNYANCFITKPIEVTDFLKAVTQVEEFWINIVSIPRA